MTATGTGPPPSIESFAWSHVTYPWPIPGGEDGAAAAGLYDAYVATTDASVYHVPIPAEFGEALTDLGYAKVRVSGGNRYLGLTEESRAARAYEYVTHGRFGLYSKEIDRLYKEAEARHMETFDHGAETVLVPGYQDPDDEPRTYTRALPCSPQCNRRLLAKTRPESDEKAVAFVLVKERDGTVATMVEAIFGPYLRWKPGEPNPGIAMAWKAIEERAGDTALRLTAAQATLAPLQSALDEVDRLFHLETEQWSPGSPQAVLWQQWQNMDGHPAIASARALVASIEAEWNANERRRATWLRENEPAPQDSTMWDSQAEPAPPAPAVVKLSQAERRAAVRVLVQDEGVSQREAARRLGVSDMTVRRDVESF